MAWPTDDDGHRGQTGSRQIPQNLEHRRNPNIPLERVLHRLVDCAIDVDDPADRGDSEALVRALRSLLASALAAHALGCARL